MAFREVLENGHVFRVIQNEKDIENYVAFNSKFNNLYEGATCKNLISHHPYVNREEFQLIEDEKTSEIISTTCLIPWQCEFDGIPMKAAMLELVLSHPDYRKSGLIRLQVNRFIQVAEDKGYDISIIWGIPYYYRQYGYTYCINGNTTEVLSVEQVPSAFDAISGDYSFRKAMEEDIEELNRLYISANKQQFYITRDEAFWKFLMNHSKYPVWLVVNKLSGEVEGYIVCGNTEGRTVHIAESGVISIDACRAVLQLIKSDKTREIVISWPENNTLVKLARSIGSTAQQENQWLVRIHNIPEFLIKIGPVLEKRIAESAFAGSTQEIIINLFRQAYRFSIKEGKLDGVISIGFKDASMGVDGGDLCIPQDAFVRLVFGFRSLEQLFDAWPDIVIKHESRYLLEVLFPKMSSYLCAPFSYQGTL